MTRDYTRCSTLCYLATGSEAYRNLKQITIKESLGTSHGFLATATALVTSWEGGKGVAKST